MLGKSEGRTKGQQRMRRLDDITNSKDVSLSKLCKTVKDWEAWHAVVHGVTVSDTTQGLHTITDKHIAWRYEGGDGNHERRDRRNRVGGCGALPQTEPHPPILSVVKGTHSSQIPSLESGCHFSFPGSPPTTWKFLL